MARCLRIDWEGSARFEGDGWHERSGHSYAVLDGAPEVLVAVEEGDGASLGRTPMLAGDLARISFPELVNLIAQGRISGVLRVYSPSATRCVVFQAGEVRGASSQRVGERLSEILMRLGLLKREAAEALEFDAETPRAMGRSAVEQGLLSERGLWTAAQELVTTVFQEILQETRGSFALCDEVDRSTLWVPGLSAEGLLLEGVRRLDELRSLRSGDAGAHSPRKVLAAFNAAFRDIFATVEQSGDGEALQRTAATIFADDPAHAAFRALRFNSGGELMESEVMEILDQLDVSERGADAQLSDALSTAMLFLLFVAGEYLAPDVHQELHSRVKARVDRG